MRNATASECSPPTQRRSSASAAPRNSPGPPHQYRMSCSTQQSAQPSFHQQVQPSVLKGRGGVAPSGCTSRQYVTARSSSPRAIVASWRYGARRCWVGAQAAREKGNTAKATGVARVGLMVSSAGAKQRAAPSPRVCASPRTPARRLRGAAAGAPGAPTDTERPLSTPRSHVGQAGGTRADRFDEWLRLEVQGPPRVRDGRCVTKEKPRAVGVFHRIHDAGH
jgi:hypothetical protein